ncbi:MAG: hypothetical protein HC860_26475 [Alkalinema sp. RU_4_3]|nr:hypothetical protein [Alkalinema sp. RU_4_3]
MAEQITLSLPDGVAQQLREVAASTQKGLEEVLLEWLDRGRSGTPSHAEPSEAELLRKINLGFSADWWADYRGLIAQRQAETISEVDLGRLIGMSEALEKANVPRIEALGKLAAMRGCSIEQVMAS